MWPFKTGDCLIEVITWAGLTVHSIINFPLFVVVYTTCEQENVIQCAIFNWLPSIFLGQCLTEWPFSNDGFGCLELVCVLEQSPWVNYRVVLGIFNIVFSKWYTNPKLRK
jgi:hypothetical protein